ncbi:hypothetical protein [Butyrivibrio sp. XPD2002]|uniref:hypothetical protein n=1 Tax=Butyrivibrio sp. XPD2002 TaxID=1280665 RepID=UPI0003FBEFBE|nr:hypothetical protein [Butyrivibrio sp. XPD2002]
MKKRKTFGGLGIVCATTVVFAGIMGCSKPANTNTEEPSIETEDNRVEDNKVEDSAANENVSEESNEQKTKSEEQKSADESEEVLQKDEAEETSQQETEKPVSGSLFDQFINDEIPAIRIAEDGTESSFNYSELPHDEEDWESYFVRDEKADVDNDGEDELIMDGPYGGMYLDERDGKVYVLTEGEGTTGYLSYADYEGKTYIVHSDTSHGGRQIYVFDRYEDGKSVENFTLSAEYWESESDTYDQDSDFTFKDQKISMEEYEALVKEIFK